MKAPEGELFLWFARQILSGNPTPWRWLADVGHVMPLGWSAFIDGLCGWIQVSVVLICSLSNPLSIMLSA